MYTTQIQRMKLYDRQEYKIVKETKLADKWDSCCPFCDIESQKEYILWKGKYWYIQHNKFPFAGTKKHLLAIPYKHEKLTRNLSWEEWIEFKKIEDFMYNFYGEESYFSFIRERGEKKSIHHLHFHFLPGELECDPIIQMLQEQWIQSDIQRNIEK